MHIAEGVLSAPVLLSGAAVAVLGVVVGLKKINSSHLMLAGLLGAAFFVASLIHVPVGISSAHLVLNGLLGVCLGWASFPVIFVALLLQAVLFQFGGFTVLGLNTATMGAGAVCAWLLYRGVVRLPLKSAAAIAGFAAGFSAVLVSGLFTALALSASDEGFKAAAWALFIANLPVMVIEGFITAFAVVFLRRVSPEMLDANK